jgi:cation:H+ antiporter
MYVDLLKLLLAICFLWLCSEAIIRSSKFFAARFRISDTFIGLTILSIGTTLPELATHIIASVDILKGSDVSGVALGANVGSNLFQITVILGIVGIFMVVRSKREFLETDYVAMLLSIILLFTYSVDGVITRIEGTVLATLYLMYLYYLGRVEHFVYKIEHEVKDSSKKSVINNLVILVAGITFLLFAANMAIDSAESLSRLWGVKDSLIGSLLVGFGAALPELAVALVALKHRSSGMSLGVLVGSNITNPLWAAGIGAMISTYTVPAEIIWFDIPFWFFASLLPLCFFYKKRFITRAQSVLLICVYLVYVIVRIKFFAF